MAEPNRVHDTDVGHQTLLQHQRTDGQFLLPSQPQADNPWPLLDKAEWRDAGEIPGVPPRSQAGNTIPPEIAASRLHDYEQAHGPELAHLPFSDYNCVPAAPAAVVAPTPQVDAAERPTPGLPYTVYQPRNKITYTEGGDWVRAVIDRRPPQPGVHRHKDKTQSYVDWTDLELHNQVIAWCDLARADKRAFLQKSDSHRPRTRTFIIPARCHKAAGAVVYDLRQILEAQAAGRPLRWIDSETGIETGVPIPAIAEDTPITPRLDKAAFLRRCEAAGIQDLYGIQQVASLGLVSASGCSRDTVLQMNYPAVSRHAAKAQAIAEKEASQGFLSTPYNSLPLSPARINPFNAIEREGKEPRFCGDLSAPQGEKDGGGLNSVNAGIPFGELDVIAQMRLTSAASFARDTGILAASALRTWIATADWARYYRQLPKPIRELFSQLQWLGPNGPQIDWATIFGDAAAPAQANRVQDILLSLIAHEFEIQLAKYRRTALGPAKPFLDALDEYSAQRLAALKEQFPDRFTPASDLIYEVRQWRDRQLRLIVLAGFFDDSLVSSFVSHEESKEFPNPDGTPGSRLLTRAHGPFELLLAAILTVADDLRLETADHKIDCGTDDGRTGRLAIDIWRDRGEIWWALKPGCMVALGKELDLEHRILRDTTARVTAFAASVSTLCATANANRRPNKKSRSARLKSAATNRPLTGDAMAPLLLGTPTAPIPDLRALIGQALFIMLTEPALRSALNVPIRGLRLIESIAPELERRLRASHKGRSHARIPWFSWAWLADAAQEALHDFALAALQRRGVPFNPTTPSLGSRNATCWVLQDASGSEGGGGGAIYLNPDGSDPHWSFDSFTPEETAAHSTYQEGMNANRNLRRALEQGSLDIIEVLDNAAWVFVSRSGAARADELHPLLTDRRQLLLRYPAARVYTVWQAREEGTLADAVSKLLLPYPTADILGRDWAHHRLQRLGYSLGLQDSRRIN